MEAEHRSSRRHQALQKLLTDDSTRPLLATATPDLPEETAAWLGRLCLLQGVPFDVLVPDARMLPAESIRFFFVDQNALDSLVDGALSVVAHTSEEATLLDVHRGRLRAVARHRAGYDRHHRRGRTVPALEPADADGSPGGDTDPPVWTGFLLRSAAVAGWPGLTVSGSAAGTPLTLLRLDRPSPSVLIAIFAGIVEQVDIAEPAQCLSFGVSAASATEPPWVSLRFIGDGKPVGEQPPGKPKVPVGFRDETRGVLDVTRLVSAIDEALTDAYAPLPRPAFGAGAFGIEMVRPAQRQPFRHPEGARPEDDDARDR